MDDWTTRSGLRRALGRYPEALADFSRAHQLDPNEAWIIANRGEAHQMMEHYDEALVDFNRGIELDPTYARAIGRRGLVYSALGRYPEALADFSRAHQLDQTRLGSSPTAARHTGRWSATTRSSRSTSTGYRDSTPYLRMGYWTSSWFLQRPRSLPRSPG